ncbi:YecA family protein [Verminephrobacter aporrectodeae subsp. tuberculatae]|uniref:UPF0149 family protein n=1 Tax=Verminephrobacter aporrectodeae TaxID=1110389 RepID=UPI00223768A6|nr:UPF0149 family protein [Verminephrobacter aporrectodeae]MCW5221909.1 YecA family protein [Verminephrobacter aporrectodeae subsp. tuberculatae]MCW5291200.1 YecA family protein [Verminephrobacter aporrectodeae subsp. tuberculatae]
MTEESTLPIANSQGRYTTALGPDDKDELEGILDGLASRGGEDIPCWEFCDGFLTALVCCRRPIPPAEYLPVLFGDDGARLEVVEGEPLPWVPVFADAAQQTRFMQLWTRRWNEVVSQLDIGLETMVDEYEFQPGVLDMRGAMADLSDEERAEMGEDYVVPPLGQLWARGFLFAVKNWIDDWEIPDDREAIQWQDRALDEIAALLEDDTGVPEVGAIEDGPLSTSRARVAVFCKAAQAAYALRQLGKVLGARMAIAQKVFKPGRNDPCPCGSGKKYKKCHG